MPDMVAAVSRHQGPKKCAPLWQFPALSLGSWRRNWRRLPPHFGPLVAVRRT
jgi:hypothetical protein